MKVNLGGIVPLSTVDWPGRAATVVFLRGCPLRCPFCQNSSLQQGENFVEFSYITNKIKRIINPDLGMNQITLTDAVNIVMAKPLISALVVSGGEPLMQLKALKMIANLAHGLGLDVSIETSGYYPDRLSELLKMNLLDKVFLDIKAPLKEPEYEIATGKKDVSNRVMESLRVCNEKGVPLTVRNTIFDFPSRGMEITRTMSELKAEFPNNRMEVKVMQIGIKRIKGSDQLEGND